MHSIDKFINTYNKYLQNDKTTFDDVTLIKKKTGLHFPKKDLSYFMNGFNFPKRYNSASFVFLQGQADVPKEFVNFAHNINHSLEYVFNKVDGSVSLYDLEYDEIEWHCANSLQNFFSIMTIIIEKQIMSQELGTFDLDRSYLLEMYQKCMEINSGSTKYSQFLEHLLGIDL